MEDEDDEQELLAALQPNAKLAAREVESQLVLLGNQHPDVVRHDGRLYAMLGEASGILHGQRAGIINSGQDRLSQLLNEIIDRWPQETVPTELWKALSTAATYGLTLSNQPLFSRPKGRAEHLR